MSNAIAINVQPFGFPSAISAAREIERRLGTLEVPLTAIGRFLVTRAHESFERQESPEGAPWQALAPATIAARQRRLEHGGARNRGSLLALPLTGGGSEKALIVTHRLMQSIASSAGATELAVGTNATFAASAGARHFGLGGASRGAIHQFGGKAGRNHTVTIPARPFLGTTDGDDIRCGEMLMAYLATI